MTSDSTSISSWVLPLSFTKVDNPKPPIFNDGINGAFLGCYYKFCPTSFYTSNSSYVLPFSFTNDERPSPPTFNDGIKGAFLVSYTFYSVLVYSGVGYLSLFVSSFLIYKNYLLRCYSSYSRPISWSKKEHTLNWNNFLLVSSSLYLAIANKHSTWRLQSSILLYYFYFLKFLLYSLTKLM